MRAARGLVTLAVLTTVACSRGGDDAKVAELEQRVRRLESRLADLPAGAADLETASADEILERLDAPDAVARMRAASAARQRFAELRIELLEALRAGSVRQREAIAIVAAQQAEATDVAGLLRALPVATEARVRAPLLMALGRTTSPDATPAVVGELAHESARVRIAAVQALALLKDPASVLPLARVALGPDPVLAPLARQAFRELGESSAHAVEAAWTSLQPREREGVLVMLGGTTGEAVDLFLRSALDDASARVALEAALQLARRGSLAGRNVALARVSSDDPDIARSARAVLDAIETGAPAGTLTTP